LAAPLACSPFVAVPTAAEPLTEALTRAYRGGKVAAEGFRVADVSEYLKQQDTLVWVDFRDPTAAQLHEIAGELGLHELAVEDALGPHQRPKLDRYDSHLFISCQAVTVDPDEGTLAESEVDAFVGERWLITVRKGSGFDIDPVLRRWDRSPDLASHGVGFLLYGLLDVVVDGYFDTVERFDVYYDEVSEAIFAERPLETEQQRRWFQMRRSIVRFHRLVVPMRETVSSLMRREHPAIAEELYPYFQDVYDHVLRVSESSDSLRDLVSTIVETNISLRDYRQNQIVKKVSGWAAIIAVPALITGYFGMNVPFPTSQSEAGVLASGALIIGVSVGLYLLFRRWDWL
jgi:magnesium transporter